MIQNNADFYRCPICLSRPEVDLRYTPEGSQLWVAFCYCFSCHATDRENLRHLWNDLYCADDPWTVYDEEDEE